MDQLIKTHEKMRKRNSKQKQDPEGNEQCSFHCRSLPCSKSHAVINKCRKLSCLLSEKLALFFGVALSSFQPIQTYMDALIQVAGSTEHSTNETRWATAKKCSIMSKQHFTLQGQSTHEWTLQLSTIRNKQRNCTGTMRLFIIDRRPLEYVESKHVILKV